MDKGYYNHRHPMPFRLIAIAFFLFPLLGATAHTTDSTSHWGGAVYVNPGRLIVMDQWQKKWQKKKGTISMAAELNYTPLPTDSDAFAQDYGYPTFSLGFRFSRNDATMHRSKDPAWGQAEEVDYDSRLGNIATVYATFTRPFFRHRHWSADYTLGTGIGYAHHKYSKGDNIDDELIGSRFLIYFTAGLHAGYRFASQWGIRGGIDFYHHSNGAMNRPNKGSNIVGPSIGIVYFPCYEYLQHQPARAECKEPFQPSLFATLILGAGRKTLHEDWQLTQYGTPPTSPDYRTSRFHAYATYSTQASLMYRYARRWASGLGIDLFHVSYASRVEEIDRQNGQTSYSHKPWSAGIAARHQVYYGNLSIAMSLGFYLYRELGQNAKEIEKPCYEHIGIRYAFSRLNHIEIGFNVKAHKTKADYTELVIAYPFTLHRFHKRP